jgi:hypothetical protein
MPPPKRWEIVISGEKRVFQQNRRILSIQPSTGLPPIVLKNSAVAVMRVA